MTDYNIFALNGITVTDKRIKEIFRLHKSGSSINWELLMKAKENALERFPDDAELINRDFETELYWTKKKLAKKGLLYETTNEPDTYDDRFDEYEDESPWLGCEEGI